MLVICTTAVVVYAAVKLNQPATTVSASRDFEIQKGETAANIIQRLLEQKLITSPLLAKIYLRFRGAESKLQAGIYNLDSHMTIPEIVQILSWGQVKVQDIRFTIIEGWTAVEIGSRLENLDMVKKADFLAATKADFSSEYGFLKDKPKSASLEGFLFPDTYVLKPGMSPETIIRRLLDNFQQRVTAKLSYQDLIVASIVEREVGRNFMKNVKLSDADWQRLQEERRLVAAVFLRRLARGLPLESDATINYITGYQDRRVKLSDLQIDSLYNTYKYRGLPPTPISNPSVDSIKAVLAPAKTDYLFFLTAPDGTAHFAQTLVEHDINRKKYLGD